ncbi:MAG: homoserine dehydrogenase [Lachnospiraceae bacterium]|nr:homoserine dehydrogenase [Lachnospiraceae bacterium]
MINIAILGYGIVGSGVACVIEKNKKEISKKAGDEIAIKYILDIREFPGDPYENKIVNNINQILDDPDVQIICETMGGIRPAYEFTKRALLEGKSVCSSNKELVASHAPELLRIARENNCNYLFEASVGGGIPIIRPLNYSLTAEKIDRIVGILNGTTNFILTKMEKEGADFATVLKEAQELGYAEKNPEADVEGHDTCRKIAILSSLMTGQNVKYESIYTEGITKITANDFVYAYALDMTIKLLAISEYDIENNLNVCVAPFLIARDHPLYFVSDVYNGIFVHGNMLGDSMYYGRGAGKLPTASAVVSDVIDAARHIGKTITCFWDDNAIKLNPMDEYRGSYFVRAKDTPENIAKVQELFPDFVVVKQAVTGDYAFTCGPVAEKDFNEKIALLPSGINSRIRICI